MLLYLHPVGNTIQFSDAADYPENSLENPPFERAGFEWTEGMPPENALPYVQLPVDQQINQLIQVLPLASQIRFLPVISQGLVALQYGNYPLLNALVSDLETETEVEADMKAAVLAILETLEAA